MIGGLLRSVVKPNAKMVVRLMSAMGEKETIGRYPDRIESMVAAGRDPIAAAADLAELRAGISLFGFRRSLRVQPAELRRLTVPTLLVWGDRDPVGGVEVANILVAPPVPFLPEAVHGKMVIDIIGVYAGPVEDGAQAAQPLRALAEPVADLMGPMPYTAMQSLLDPL
jgi:pimeloyl-ACP methyl ester carboxylesterase